MTDTNHPLFNLIVPGVLWILVLFSIATWAILLMKTAQFIHRKRGDQQFHEKFWNATDMLSAAECSQQYDGGLARTARAGFDAMHLAFGPSINTGQLARSVHVEERVERYLHNQIRQERRALESGLAILASIGSTAPFVGLFGTVWGIMEALQKIGLSGSASLDSVAGPIGHALIATAVGIGVAVPAVLIYNFFIRRLKLALSRMEDFAHDFEDLAQRSHFTVSRQPVAELQELVVEGSA
ncbi:MotA/TolQ/ExbB proton channel family protein [Herbaspirillum camelliae]|uniref:MotA/TolQ/ExbB proton channel family protein n=1 Tax=Herbaspirillum camelliae TaxID=1892903 RepID=UPI000B181A6C|nr:MotA/TolQ/ExbB proton channel family protein [Herbaspirillum camelliae]